MANVKRVEKDIQALYKISAPCEEGCTRLSYTPAFREGIEYLKKIMTNLGMEVREDNLGTLYGTVKGTNPDAPPIYTGSHLDTVKCAGGYDGPAGIIASLEAARMLIESGKPMESDLVVTVTLMEDGGRYPGTTGSRFMVGVYGDAELTSLVDDDGIPLIEAMKSYGLPGNLDGVCLKGKPAKAFLELHMEQALKLKDSNTDIGIVHAICGNAWYKVIAHGRANHPATPHNVRKDTSLASFRMYTRLEDKIRSDYLDKATVTCGKMELHPGVVNSVPSRAVFTVDFRSFSPDILDECTEMLKQELGKAGNEYNVDFEMSLIKRSEPVTNSENVISTFEKACKNLGYSSMPLNSGAGHDTMFLRQIWDAGLIFIPSHNDGVTHCPEEYTPPECLAKGADVILECARIIDAENR